MQQPIIQPQAKWGTRCNLATVPVGGFCTAHSPLVLVHALPKPPCHASLIHTHPAAVAITRAGVTVSSSHQVGLGLPHSTSHPPNSLIAHFAPHSYTPSMGVTAEGVAQQALDTRAQSGDTMTSACQAACTQAEVPTKAPNPLQSVVGKMPRKPLNRSCNRSCSAPLAVCPSGDFRTGVAGDLSSAENPNKGPASAAAQRRLPLPEWRLADPAWLDTSAEHSSRVWCAPPLEWSSQLVDGAAPARAHGFFILRTHPKPRLEVHPARDNAVSPPWKDCCVMPLRESKQEDDAAAPKPAEHQAVRRAGTRAAYLYLVNKALFVTTTLPGISGLKFSTCPKCTGSYYQRGRQKPYIRVSVY